MVFDIDGTREAARQRALPQTEELPPASRRLDEICAPGYRGRKRGQVVRTRTVISQAHSFQWLGSSGAPLATGAIAWNCARASQQLHATSRHTSFRRSVSCCISLGNMGRERCLLTWLGSCVRLSRTCLLSASTHRLVAYSPVRIPFRRSGR